MKNVAVIFIVMSFSFMTNVLAEEVTDNIDYETPEITNIIDEMYKSDTVSSTDIITFIQDNLITNPSILEDFKHIDSLLSVSDKGANVTIEYKLVEDTSSSESIFDEKSYITKYITLRVGERNAYKLAEVFKHTQSTSYSNWQLLIYVVCVLLLIGLGLILITYE